MNVPADGLYEVQPPAAKVGRLLELADIAMATDTFVLITARSYGATSGGHSLLLFDGATGACTSQFARFQSFVGFKGAVIEIWSVEVF